MFTCSWIIKKDVSFFVSHVNTLINTLLKIVSLHFALGILKAFQWFIRMSWRSWSFFILNENSLRMSYSWFQQKSSFWSARFIFFYVTPVMNLDVFVWRLNNFLSFSMFIYKVWFFLFITNRRYIWNWKSSKLTSWSYIIFNMLDINWS